MEVLYDYQIFIAQRFGGISRYFCELMKNSTDLFNYSISGLYSNNEYLRELEILKRFPVDISFPGKYRVIKTINRICAQNKILKGKYDLIHPTYYDPELIVNNRKPVVVTVYDMIHEIFPAFMSADIGTISNKLTMMKKADAIIAISESTKNDILKFYPELSNKKIYVVYLGNSMINVKKDESQELPYLLFTGQRDSYKNFYNFVIAVAPLLKKNNLSLKCTGKPFSKEEQVLLNNEEILDRTWCGFVDDTALRELYSHALAFVFPSRYEGFGIPVLEAFGSYCPAIISNVSSLPEVGGNGAEYFDPNDIEDIRKKVEEVISSKELRNSMRIAGFEQLKKFSWKKCAEETFSVYQNLI
jgi:glycosyltransferase involved in cell wall biosynthesis